MEALDENQNEIIENEIKEEKEEKEAKEENEIKEENEEKEESEENEEINDKDSSCFERLCKLQKLIKEESSLGKMCK